MDVRYSLYDYELKYFLLRRMVWSNLSLFGDLY
jgi:hypothetical protein